MSSSATPPDDPQRALIVLARAPELGRVKTRLAAALGVETALTIYRRLAERTIAEMQRTSGCSVTVAFTPDDAEPAMRQWLDGSIALRPQAHGDLGARMANAIEDAVADGANRVVVVGTDCPDMTTSTIKDAFARLDRSDIVFGPATDGGYYLVGMSRVHRVIFEGIPWSSRETLAVSMEAVRASGLTVDLLEELSDVDTVDDWRAWLARSRQGADSQR